MTLKAFQSTFNPVTSYLWPEYTENCPETPYQELWISNLPRNISEQEVRVLFAAFGPVAILKVVNKSPAFAHVLYCHWSSGIRAMCNLNNCSIRGKRIKVAIYVDDAAKHRHSRGSSTVYLQGFPNNFTMTELFDHLRGFGLIISLSFVGPNDKWHPKSARVEFYQERNAETVVQNLKGYLLGGWRINACLWADRAILTQSFSTEKLFVQELLPAIDRSPFQDGSFQPRPIDKGPSLGLRHHRPSSAAPPGPSVISPPPFGMPPFPPMSFAPKPTVSAPRFSAGVQMEIASLMHNLNGFFQTGIPERLAFPRLAFPLVE